MRKNLVAAIVGGASLAVAVPAAAQSWTPGAEIAGHSVRVGFANGATNTLYFDPNGTVRIAGGDGMELAQGRWFVQNNNLCIEAGAGLRECWAYQTPFQAQRAVTLTSDCGSTSQWTALSTNQPPTQRRAGERG
jgi:hypothetical protein